MTAARDRALVALARDRSFARKIAANVRGRTAAVLVDDSNAYALFLPGPTRGRVVVRFAGESGEVMLTSAAVRRLFG